MPHEYDDPFSPQSLETAVHTALKFRAERPDLPLRHHIAIAVDQAICGCATSIQDAIEGGESGLHAAILLEVEQRIILADRNSRAEASAVIDRASDDSFPASDPPAWIHNPR